MEKTGEEGSEGLGMEDWFKSTVQDVLGQMLGGS